MRHHRYGFTKMLIFFCLGATTLLPVKAGTIESAQGRIYTLSADGSCRGNMETHIMGGSWRQDGDFITITWRSYAHPQTAAQNPESEWTRFEGGSSSERYKVVNGELVLKNGGFPADTLRVKYRAREPSPASFVYEPPAKTQEVPPARVDRKGFVEEPITDEKYRAEVDAELKAAEKQWSRDERRKEDEFERIHKEKLEEWRTKLRNHTATYDDHPDVVMMKQLTGQEGTLIAPSIAREYDNILMDRGWYPFAAKGGDWRYSKTDRERYERGRYSADGFKVEETHPDVPKGIKVPAYNAMRDHFLNKPPAASK